MTVAAAPAQKPAYYYGWNIVAICIICQLASLGLSINCFSLFLNVWSREFAAPITALAVGMAILGLGTLFLAPVVGWVLGKAPIRAIMALGLVCVGVGNVVVGFAPNAWAVVATYATLIPLGVVFSTLIPAQTLVSRWFVRRRGLALGLCAFGIALAGVIFPPIITWLMPMIGWRAVWHIFGLGAVLLIAPFVYFTLRERPTPEEGADYVTAEETHARGADLPYKEIFSRPNFWIVVIAFVTTGSAASVVTVILAPAVIERGFSLQTAGLLLSTLSFSALVSKLGIGLLRDRVGDRIPLVLLGVNTAAGAALFAVAHTTPLLYLSCVLIGFIAGNWTVLASATAAEFGPHGFARAYGVISVCTSIGTVSTPLATWIHDKTGTYSIPLFALAAFAAVGACVSLLLNEKRGARAA